MSLRAQHWSTFLAATAATALIFFDETAVATALPMMQSHLGLSLSGTQWVVNAYVLGLASLLAFGGRLGDVFGHRLVFVVGMSLYTVASLAAGAANSELALLTARGAQGVGAALASPNALALISTSYPPQRRGKAIGLMLGISAVFLVVGPVIGGAITDSLGWRWVLWIAAPLSLGAVALAFVRPDFSRPAHRSPLEVTGMALFIVALGSLTLAIMQANTWGWSSTQVTLLLAAAVIAGALFVVHERATQDPLVDPGLIRNPRFAVACAVGFAMRFSVIGPLVFLVLFLQLVLGWSALMAGVGILPAVVPAALLAPVSGSITDRRGPKPMMLVGVATMLIAILALIVVASTRAYAWLIPGLVLFGAGSAFAVTPTTTLALSAAPKAQHGIAGGMLTSISAGIRAVSVWRRLFTSSQKLAQAAPNSRKES